MKKKPGFLKTYEDIEHDWMWDNNPIQDEEGTAVQINDKNCNITPGFRNVLVTSSKNTAKSLNDMQKVAFSNVLHTIE